MKIGLLICDHVNQQQSQIYGTYQTMLHRSLTAASMATLITIEIVDYWVIDNQFPLSVDECDVYVSSGSEFSVNDELEWVLNLKQFIQQLYFKHKGFFGICFGHQLIAAALDGTVEFSDKGWGLGVSQVEVLNRADRFAALNGKMTLPVSHQEQVIKLPSDTDVLASSDFCENFMMQTGRCFLGIQGHPEFTTDYARCLVDSMESKVPLETINKAYDSFNQQVNSDAVMAMALQFLQKCV